MTANGSTGHDFTIDIYVQNLEASYYKSTVSLDNSTIASMCCFDIYWYCADGSTGNLTSTSETYTLISSYSQTWTSSSTSSKTNKTGLTYAQYKYTNSSKTYKRYAKVVLHINDSAVEQWGFISDGGSVLKGKSVYYIYSSGYITDSESVAQSNCTEFLTGSYSLYFNQTVTLYFYGYLNSNSTSMSLLNSILGYEITIPIYTGYTPSYYTFSGWRNRNNLSLYQSGNSIRPYNVYDSSGGNWERFDADFAPNVYEITLDSQYRSSSSEISGTVVDSSGTGTIYEKYETGFYSDEACSSKIETITMPTYTGYTFQGYYTERAGTGTQVIDSSGKITASKYKWTEDSFIFAHYTINTYYFTVQYYREYVTDSVLIKVSLISSSGTTGTLEDNYNLNDSTYNDGILGYNSVATISHDFDSVNDYTIAITIINSNSNCYYYMNATTSSSTIPTTSSIINCVTYPWSPTSNEGIYVNVYQRYTITYNGNGYTSGTVPSTQYKIHGTSLTLSSNSLTKTNYSANGWNTATAYKATPNYTSSSTYSTNANLTLYANFVPNTCSVTIKLMTVTKTGTASNSTTGGTVSVKSTVYDTSSATLVTTQTVSITSTSATQTVQKNQTMTFTPTTTSGYVFCGVSSSSSVPTVNEITSSVTPTSATTYYVYFKELSTNQLKYDSTNKYYYFEDGYMPQTYAEMISSGLNATITSNGTLMGTYSLENGTTYKLASYSGYYYLGFTAPKTMSLTLESYTTSGTYSFTKGTTYWFRFEPIRWRVSSDDWYNNGYIGMYDTNYTVVSDLVLWYDCMDTNENHIEGDKAYDMSFTSSLRSGNFETMLSTFVTQYANGKLMYSGLNNTEYQKFGETGQQNPVQVDTSHTTSSYSLTKTNKYTSGSTSSLRVASTDEISDTVGNTKAEASCLVAFLMGSSNDQYSKYWTRDLGNNLNAGKVVAKNGLTRSEWLTNSNGIRFAYTMSEGSRGNL